MVALHWTVSRKLKLMRDLHTGEVTFPQAMEEHALSREELSIWASRYAAHGEAGLMVTKIQENRA